MKKFLFNTSTSLAPLPARILLAIVLFPHGAQKLFGWFGGFGFTGTMNYFTETVGLPWIVGLLVILLEVIAPVALLAGFATRFFAIALVFVFGGIIFSVHHDYFFMNWFGVQKGEGAEFFLLGIALSVSLAISGAGAFSLDHYLVRAAKPHRNRAIHTTKSMVA